MAQWSESDRRWMTQALALARACEGYTNPNPMVGAVIVKDQQPIGQGATAPYGGEHAEWRALERAGAHAQGATLYVNWEPCVAYPGKQTPPCVGRIIQSGISRVVVAALDPHPQVNQNGINQLKAAGVRVEVGLLEAESQRLNEVSIVYHQKNRPFVCLKWAMTLDGHIATRTGDSRWITNQASRLCAHRLRHRYAAVLVGVNTVIKDDPALTVRHVEGKDPWRIVLDASGKTPPSAKLLQQDGDAPTVIAATDSITSDRERALTAAGAQVWRLPEDDGKVDIKSLLVKMKQQQLDSVLVEGGGQVHWSFLSRRLFDKVECFIAPKLIGGQAAPSPVGGEGVSLIREAFQLKNLAAESLDGDWRITGYPE